MDKEKSRSRLIYSGTEAILLAAAFWPVWCWYVLRTFDGSDEPWGLLALATAAYFIARAGDACAGVSGRPRMHTAVVAALLAVYSLAFPVTPHLVQGMIMVAALWFCFGAKTPVEWRWGIFGLLLLSLPIIPSINFFCGYPLRLLVAQAAQLLLSCVGIATIKEGTLLVIGGNPVSIDAPCSGISMLWVELYTAMALACYFKLTARRTAVLTGVAVALVLLANSVRAVALILFDRICQLPGFGAQVTAYEPTVHVGAGAMAFLATAVATAVIAARLNQSRRVSGALEGSIIAPARELRVPACSPAMLYSLAVCAAVVPLLARTSGSGTLNTPPPNWPTEILGRPVTVVQALDEEKAFAADFPGYMRRFTDGTNSYFVRVVNKETRQLHPSSDCFKGMGYSIEPQPLVLSSDGTRWSSFLARKGTACYLIMEQLHDSHGHTWTDVSEWYWHALMHETDAPWWDITIAQPR